mmetsp:Transcript_38946/g.82805  ORF Transcript_38946/g.82805 Transcript_38946/m.82805 type:complete len:280 (+) Transcript_38946:3-842(+)
MDYQKYMASTGGVKSSLYASAGAGSQSNFAAQDIGGKKLMNSGGDADGLVAGSDEEAGRKEFSNYETYMDYQKYTEWHDLIQSRGLKSVPVSAADCHTVKELNVWRDTLMNSSKNMVPASFRKYAETPIDEEYEQRLEQLQNSSSVDTTWKFDVSDPAREGDLLSELKKELNNRTSSAPTSAKKCHSEAELKRWRHHQEKMLKATTPKFLQPMLLQNVAKEYQQNLARIHIEEANAKEGNGTTSTQPGHPKAVIELSDEQKEAPAAAAAAAATARPNLF